MVSTRYFDNRGKAVLDALRTFGKKPAGRSGDSATMSPQSERVLNRWFGSVYLCRDNQKRLAA
jgi:hypothetical protein